MTLKERLGIAAKVAQAKPDAFAEFGVARNPFPTSSQSSGHPRQPDSADRSVESRLAAFLNDFTSQVVVVEGTQGTGKTNLLQYYERELPALDDSTSGMFVIHYYPDPEPVLDKLLAHIVQSFGTAHLTALITALKIMNEDAASELISGARGADFRQMLWKLVRGRNTGTHAQDAHDLAMEWLRGLRIYKRHTEALGVYQRLDTTESRIQALRDLLYVSEHLGLFRALFLLLDELEKQEDVSRASIHVVRYLASLRALIDSLPRRLFLILAITPSARDTYRRYYPALASRLEGSVVTLPTVDTAEAAIKLYHFYLDEERRRTLDGGGQPSSKTRARNPFSDKEIEEFFKSAAYDARSYSGRLTPRTWLQRLHEKFAELSTKPVAT